MRKPDPKIWNLATIEKDVLRLVIAQDLTVGEAQQAIYKVQCLISQTGIPIESFRACLKDVPTEKMPPAARLRKLDPAKHGISKFEQEILATVINAALSMVEAKQHLQKVKDLFEFSGIPADAFQELLDYEEIPAGDSKEHAGEA